MEEITNREQLKECADSILLGCRWRAAKSRLADYEILSKLSKDEDSVIRFAVVENENVTNHILLEMFLVEQVDFVAKAIVNKMKRRNMVKELN